MDREDRKIQFIGDTRAAQEPAGIQQPRYRCLNQRMGFSRICNEVLLVVLNFMFKKIIKFLLVGLQKQDVEK